MYYRRSDSSYIFKWVSQIKDGESLPESTGAFWDNKTASAYRLDYQNKRAVLEAKHKLPMQPNTSIATIEMDRRYGRASSRHSMPGSSVSIHMPSGNDVPAGQMCISRENNLTLKKEETYSVAGNDTFHVLMEYYDIALGVEPDAKLFDFSQSFTVFRACNRKQKRNDSYDFGPSKMSFSWWRPLRLLFRFGHS